MATYENPYAVAKPLDPMFTVGRELRTVQAQIAIGAESANNDVIILAKGISPTARVARIMLPAGSAALTGCSPAKRSWSSASTPCSRRVFITALRTLTG